MLAAVLLLPFLFSCAGKDVPALPENEPEAVQNGVSGGETVNPYSYLADNYTVSDGTLNAAPTADGGGEQRFSGAMLETGEENYAAEITVVLDSVYSSAGLLFAASESDAYDGVEGYALMVRDKRI